jgi:hypothetical protein
VIASVNGRRMVKRVPMPRSERTSSVPPSWRTSLATTSMPTPRPAASVTREAVLKPGCRMRRSASPSVSVAVGSSVPSDWLFLDRLDVGTGAVVGDVDDHV